MIRQTLHNELLKRLKEKRRFLQVLAGPRQVGKTTLVRQVNGTNALLYGDATFASTNMPLTTTYTAIAKDAYYCEPICD